MSGWIDIMIFITFLRALATCIITNSHYNGIYPSDIIANGGLFGNIIFFAVSGYCLCNVKQGFFKWYLKRVYRIYLPVIIATLFFFIFGLKDYNEHSIIYWFVYPTDYHFIASIIVLYIPFYFIMRLPLLKCNLRKVMLSIFLLWLLIYVAFYDKSYYHIDVVDEYMVRFLYMEAMLMGALFRKNDDIIRDKVKFRYLIFFIISFFLYFISKSIFVAFDVVSCLQFINPILISFPLYFLFRFSMGIDYLLYKLPKFIRKIMDMLASMTLEIYIVQFVIINFIQKSNVNIFPINWLLLSLLIFISAFILHVFCKYLYKCIDHFRFDIKDFFE